jgi:outer membrane protein assembly factor BamB
LPTPTAELIPAKASSGHSIALTLANGVAYLGTVDNAVYALRMSDGRVLWKRQIDGSVNTQPIVSNGRVYVSSYAGQNGPGYVYALQANNGSVLWRHTSEGYMYVTTSEDGGTLYVAAQDGIDALLSSDGYMLWHFSTKGASSDNPVVANRIIYATSSLNGEPGTLYALDASTGRLLWQYQEGDYVSVSIVSNGIAYLDSNDGTLAALRVSDGHALWQRKIDTNLIQPLQLVDGILYTSVTKITYSSAMQSGSPFQGMASIGSLLWNDWQAAPVKPGIPLKEGVSTVYAIRASDGAVLWRYPLLNGQDSWTDWFSVANGAVYVSAFSATSQNSEGDIYALQSGNGAVIWHDQMQLNPYNAVFANGIIYLSSSDNNSGSGAVYAIRAGDGAYLWSYPISGNVSNAPVLAGKALYIGADNGITYALKAGNGAIMWHFQTDVGF